MAHGDDLVTPAVLDRRPSDVDAVERSWVPDGRKEPLAEDATSPSRRKQQWGSSRMDETLGTPERSTRHGRLRRSFATVDALRADTDGADWIEAAATLKRDAVRLRNTHLARHSSVLLAIADALTFTRRDDPSLTKETVIFDRGLALLSEPFIAEPAEEDFLVELLSEGWNLAPASALDAPEG
jgi:hypothetical protein